MNRRKSASGREKRNRKGLIVEEKKREKHQKLGRADSY